MERLNDFKEFERFLAQFTNYERIVDFSYDRKTFGPQRMRLLAESVGNPWRAYPVVHVAGTKGKGSTCLMLEALLAAEGYLVGTYTSPHVEHLTERIRIGKKPSSEKEVVAETNAMLPYLRRAEREKPETFPSFFEIMTALAFCVLRTRKVECGIFEVGLGGRLDATNIVEPAWTAITSLGLEHTRQLGNTLAAVAREKGGIIKPGVPLILGAVAPEAEEVLLSLAAQRAAPVRRPAPGSVAAPRPGYLEIAGLQGVFEAGAVRGPALRADFELALMLHEQFLERKRRQPTPEAIAAALSQLELPARVEVFDGDPPLVIDGAHTVESIRALRQTLEEIRFPSPRTLIFSLASDKRADAIARELESMNAQDVLLTSADSSRSFSPEILRRTIGRGEVFDSPGAAFEEARRRGRPIVITGSFYLAGLLRSTARGLAIASKSP